MQNVIAEALFYAYFTEGRDIGSYVFPNAEFKFFLLADISVRATRRMKDLQKLGESRSLNRLKKDGRYNWKIRFGPNCGFRDQKKGSGYFLYESNTNILETY